MRPFVRRTLGLTVASAMLAGSIMPTPANAQIFRDRDRGDDVDVEDILIGVAVLAGVVAVASEIFKDRDRDWGRDRDRDDDRSAAIDECTRTAEREAERYGRYARVRDISDVDRDGSEYRVRGVVEVDRDDGRDIRDPDGYARAKFTCTARYGRVTAFRFTEGFDYAYRD